MDQPGPPQLLFSCPDRWGRLVIARSDRWTGHIEAKHAELVGRSAEVEATIRQPDFVTFDATYPDRENFYRFGALPHLSHLYLKVCVGFGPVAISPRDLGGSVITAYPTPDVGRGEVQKWP